MKMEIISYFVGKIVDYMPAFLMSLIFPPKKVSRQIEIRLRGENPISLARGTEVPCIDLYFEITNHSYLTLVLERMLIDVWFGQPTFQGAVLRRCIVPARNTMKDVSYKQSLTTAQQKQIEQFSNTSVVHGQIQIYLTAYFESKAGIIEIQGNIERSKI